MISEAPLLDLLKPAVPLSWQLWFLSVSRKHNTPSLPEYATNAAAIAGGRKIGQLYHTAGAVKQVI